MCSPKINRRGGGWVPTHFKVSLQLQLRLSWAVTIEVTAFPCCRATPAQRRSDQLTQTQIVLLLILSFYLNQLKDTV